MGHRVTRQPHAGRGAQGKADMDTVPAREGNGTQRLDIQVGTLCNPKVGI